MSSFASLRESERQAAANRPRLGEYHDGVRQYLCRLCNDTGRYRTKTVGTIDCRDCPICEECNEPIRHSDGLHLRDPHSDRRWCRLDCFSEALHGVCTCQRVGLIAPVLGEFYARFEEETDANSTREDLYVGLCELLKRYL